MRNLALRYRPLSLDSIYGQEKAVAMLRRHLASRSNQSVLLVGPSGTGKTTAARITGASILCDRANGDVCHECSSCHDILAEGRTFTFGWYEFDGARFNEKRHTDDVISLTAGEHPFPWAAFVDEIHALQGPAADALLKAVEEPGPRSHFIAATTDLAAVRPALRKRCLLINFVPISGANLFRLLSEVCRKEGLRFEPRALDMIGSASAGSAREALNMLDQVSWQGDVSAELVADTLAFGSASHVVEFFDAVLAADGNAQEAALYAWQAEPAEKAKMIRDYLLYVYNFEVTKPALNQMVNPAFFTVSAEERGRLVSGMRARTGGRALQDFWLDLFAPWEFVPGALSDHTALSIRTRRFDRLLNPTNEPILIVPQLSKQGDPAVERVHPYRSRSKKLPVVGTRLRTLASSKSYLDLAQAERIYEAATFLPQHYGVLLNTRIKLDHHKLGAGDEGSAAKLISDLTHELGMRVGSAHPLHWLYVHELGEHGIVTEIVAHVPPAALLSVNDWLRPRLKAWRGQAAYDKDAVVHDAPHVLRATGWQKRRVARHWSLVHRLWRGLHPSIGFPDAEGQKVALVQLLGVPPRVARPGRRTDQPAPHQQLGIAGPWFAQECGIRKNEVPLRAGRQRLELDRQRLGA